MAGMRSALVIAGDIRPVIAAFTIIPTAIVVAMAYWFVRKPRYDGLRAFGLAAVAGIIAFLLLMLWVATA